MKRVVALALTEGREKDIAAWKSIGCFGIELRRMETASSLLHQVDDPDVKIVILDGDMPVERCLGVIGQLKETYPFLPIVVLSHCDDLLSAISLLDGGADDCISLTVPPAFLVARIRAHIRRAELFCSSVEVAETHEFGSLRIDLEAREVSVDGKKVHLTKTEFELLAYLAAHPGKVLPKHRILEDVWGTELINYEKSIT
ncbi:MAG: response regulator transcription factor, partial [Bdellovibrionales bacterium]|nr:response regulator transcription factor [Bdellovibrionales bacterium]